jgi:hypothetical protein
MKEIEKLVRSSDWSPHLRAAFFAHLDKPMKDDARLGYCERKASFMLRSGNRSVAKAAVALLDFALETFTKASKDVQSLARITRGMARREAGVRKPAKRRRSK